MKFSIVIPHYNDLEGLKRCLDSIYKQSISKDFYEIIIVDDCSPASIEPTVTQLYPDSRFYRLPVNSGPGAARNYGSSKATGEFLAFVDSDAEVSTEWLLAFDEQFGKGENIICGPVWHGTSYLARLTAITCFGEYQDDRDGVRKACPSVNYSIRAKIMDRFKYEEKMGFAGEDALITAQFRKVGLCISYIARASVFHNPYLSFRSMNRRSYLYGIGFRASRRREETLSGYQFHKYLRGFSAFPLFFIRIILDHLRIIKYRKVTKLKVPELFALSVGIVWVRLIYAAGVIVGYTAKRY